jgi:hypothetical protein
LGSVESPKPIAYAGYIRNHAPSPHFQPAGSHGKIHARDSGIEFKD